MAEVVVFGQLARDLVLRVGEVPGAGRSAKVRSRRELLGGKGANQAVGLTQLGTRTAVVGVVGDDRTGRDLIAQADEDGIDTAHVVRRAGTPTGLIVDIVDDHAGWHYLEDLPREVLLDERDVFAASELVRRAASVVIQLQQPIGVALTVAHQARAEGVRVVLDGAPDASARRGELLACADVVRADAREGEQLTGERLGTVSEASDAAVRLLQEGPSLVVLEVEGEGDLFAGGDGSEFFPHASSEVVDTTGAGDALVAALTHALTRGESPRAAARLAVAAAAATTEHAGGRPRLSPGLADRALSFRTR